MKKLLLVVLYLLFVALNVNCFNAFAEGEEKVKVIFSSINVFADTNINADLDGDGENFDIIIVAKYNDVFTLKDLIVVNGDDGFNYYSINLENISNVTEGFVLCSQVVSVNNTSPIKDLDANAKIKNETNTYNFVGGQYIESDVVLEKGSKIKILHGYNKDEEYTLIQYKTEDRNIVNAYILTKDIKVSGISKTTIGAVLIIITSVTLLLIIFGIKGRKKKKSKVK